MPSLVPIFRGKQNNYIASFNRLKVGLSDLVSQHTRGRALTSDWSVNSFIVIVYDKIIFSFVLWTENSDWTLSDLASQNTSGRALTSDRSVISLRQPLQNYFRASKRRVRALPTGCSTAGKKTPSP